MTIDRKLVTALIFSLSILKNVRGINKIIGGQRTDIEDVPYQLQLIRNNMQICGAVLISPVKAVSAAHCFQTRGTYQIVAGTNLHYIQSEGTDGQLVFVKKVYLHPSFNKYNTDSDVAVLILNQPLKFSNKVQPVRLPRKDEPIPANQFGLVSGFGSITEDGTILALYLRSVRLKILSKWQCIHAYGFFNVITDNMLCAGTQADKDSCEGDSGGPLVLNNTLYGIVSWGVACGSSKYPGVYTNVAKFVDFIEKNS